MESSSDDNESNPNLKNWLSFEEEMSTSGTYPVTKIGINSLSPEFVSRSPKLCSEVVCVDSSRWEVKSY